MSDEDDIFIGRDTFDPDWDDDAEPEVGDEGRNLGDLIDEYVPLIQELLKKDNISISYDNDDTEDYWEFRINSGLQFVQGWSMSQLMGCCGVLVSYAAHTDWEYKQKGLGALMMQFKEAVAKRWGYSSLMLTDISNHAYPQSLVKKQGFKEAHTFLNKRTGNRVGVYIKDL